MQDVPGKGQQGLGEADRKTVSAVADPGTEQIRPVFARHHCRQDAVAVEQLDRDGLVRFGRIPDPALDAAPIGIIDIAAQRALDESACRLGRRIRLLCRDLRQNQLLGSGIGELRRFGGALKHDRRTRHLGTGIGTPQVQNMDAGGQEFRVERDAEAVPPIADARQDQPWPILVGHCGRQPDFALDQFEPDPFAGRLRVPSPALYAGRLDLIDVAMKRARGRERALTDIG